MSDSPITRQATEISSLHIYYSFRIDCTTSPNPRKPALLPEAAQLLLCRVTVVPSRRIMHRHTFIYNYIYIYGGGVLRMGHCRTFLKSSISSLNARKSPKLCSRSIISSLICPARLLRSEIQANMGMMKEVSRGTQNKIRILCRDQTMRERIVCGAVRTEAVPGSPPFGIQECASEARGQAQPRSCPSAL